MNNRERYKEVFNKIESPDYKSMDEIMAKKQKNFRASRRLLTVLCLIVVLLVGTVTVNAATGGLVGDYFSNLLGGDEAIAVITWSDNESECRIEVNMKESSVGIYNENNKLVNNITSEEANNIAFASDNQSCTFNGNKYKVILVCGVNEETGECQNQVRLYDPADFDKAHRQFNADQIFKDDKLTVYCPYIDIE